MYEAFYGFSEKPFSLQTDPSFLYMGKSHSAAFAMLEYSVLNRAGFTVVTGEIGSGKTTLLQRLFAGLGRNHVIGLVNNTHTTMGRLLPWVLHAFGQPYLETNAIAQYAQFVKFLEGVHSQGARAVLVIDEAQNLSLSTLEELRTFSNVNMGKELLLQVVLVGQPELREALLNPELKQLAQRVSVDYHIPTLELEETREYIAHRMQAAGRVEPIFTDDACSLLHYVSSGVPRLVNVMCDTALCFGFSDRKETLDEEYVKGVLKERSEGGILALDRDPEGYYCNKTVKQLDVDELLEKGWDNGRNYLPEIG